MTMIAQFIFPRTLKISEWRGLQRPQALQNTRGLGCDSFSPSLALFQLKGPLYSNSSLSAKVNMVHSCMDIESLHISTI
jgi:hypothetical protein